MRQEARENGGTEVGRPHVISTSVRGFGYGILGVTLVGLAGCSSSAPTLPRQLIRHRRISLFNKRSCSTLRKCLRQRCKGSRGLPRPLAQTCLAVAQSRLRSRSCTRTVWVPTWRTEYWQARSTPIAPAIRRSCKLGPTRPSCLGSRPRALAGPVGLHG